MRATLFYPSCFVPSASPPCFGDILFRKFVPGIDNNEADFFIPVVDEKLRILSFEKAEKINIFFEFPKSSGANALIIGIGNEIPSAFCFEQSRLLLESSFSKMVAAVSKSLQPEDIQTSPFVALNVARFSGNAELQLDAAKAAYLKLYSIRRGLNELWLSSASLNEPTRKYLNLHGSRLISEWLLKNSSQNEGKSLRKVAVFDVGGVFDLKSTSYNEAEPMDVMFTHSWSLDDVRWDDTFLAIVAPPYYFKVEDLPSVFGNKKLVAVQTNHFPLVDYSAWLKKHNVLHLKYPKPPGGDKIKSDILVYLDREMSADY